MTQELTSVDFAIRPPRLEDAPELAKLRRANWLELYGPIVEPQWLHKQLEFITPQEYRNRISRFLRGETFMCVAYSSSGASQPVGYIEARQNEFGYARSHSSEPEVYDTEVRSLHVKPDFRGKGIGSILLVAMLDDWVQGRDCYVEVASDTPAVGFYHQFGFTNQIGDYAWGEITLLMLQRRADALASAN